MKTGIFKTKGAMIVTIALCAVLVLSLSVSAFAAVENRDKTTFEVIAPEGAPKFQTITSDAVTNGDVKLDDGVPRIIITEGTSSEFEVIAPEGAPEFQTITSDAVTNGDVKLDDSVPRIIYTPAR
jgi:hypothetical protein